MVTFRLQPGFEKRCQELESRCQCLHVSVSKGLGLGNITAAIMSTG